LLRRAFAASPEDYGRGTGSRSEAIPDRPGVGSRIAQAIGIFGVAFTLFQGLEPFLEFSRFMSYLVNRWRELTRGLWIWLASFVHLDLE
jgi:hypothetical protein